MTKELREIEDSLNELEKRGVELEMRLRKSEGGDAEAPHRADGLLGPRLTVPVFVCQRATTTRSRMSSWSSGSA